MPRGRPARALRPDRPRRPGPREEPRARPGLDDGSQVEGRRAVHELLVSGRRAVHELFVAPGHTGADELAELARERGVPVRRVGRGELEGIARSAVHQGVVARAAPIPSRDLAEVLAGPGAPFLLVCDEITDPHNLGALIRSAAAAGVTGAVLGRHRAPGLTPTVMKAAAGALEHVAVARVGGIPAALQALAGAGVWRVGLDADGAVDLEDVAVLTEPVALVVGSEGRGLSPLVAERCDVVASIPIVGPVESLNVAAAAAIACFTVARRRAAPGPPTGPGGPPRALETP